MPGAYKARPGIGSGAGDKQADQAAARVTQLRRPCRYCDRSRPLVPIGSSRWWDMCARCARGLSNVQRRYGFKVDAVELEPIDPWAERIAEILADAEARCS